MAFSRWGQPLGIDLKMVTGHEDAVDAIVAWQRLDLEGRERIAAEQGGVLSGWYIFAHNDSDDTIGRAGQLLAVWKAGNEELPLINYGELRTVADNDEWHLVPGFDPDDHGLDIAHLKRCVTDWLAEVEEEFPPEPWLSAVALAEHWATRAEVAVDAAAKAQGNDRSEHMIQWAQARQAAQRVAELAQRSETRGRPEAGTLSEIARRTRQAVEWVSPSSPSTQE